VSLLDERREVEIRRRLPAGVRMYTGDDFNYPTLIEGDERGHSDALLGIFDAIAPAASAALQALDRDDRPRYNEILEPTVVLSRRLFEAPTYYYKTGIVFLAYLNGHQGHFRMVGGQEAMRSVVHLAHLLVLADRAQLFDDPELASARMRHVLARRRRLNARPAAARPVPAEPQSGHDQQLDSAGSGRRLCAARAALDRPLAGQGRGLRTAANRAADARSRRRGVKPLPGRLFPAATASERRRRVEDNLRAVDEAHELGTDVLVLVCGPAVDGDLEAARRFVADGIAEVAQYAAKAAVRLGIEPLHPMFAADRSVVVTLAEASALAEAFPDGSVGLVIDVYHVWWDPELAAQIRRASGRMVGFHVSDWLSPPPDHLLGRGMMGDGVIQLRKIRGLVEGAGYRGPVEVEIFNRQLWNMPGDEVLELIKSRALASV
jgi:sugar phosphate isomerase/epimerase